MKLQKVSGREIEGVKPFLGFCSGGGGTGAVSAGYMVAAAQAGLLSYCKCLFGTSVGGLLALLFALAGKNIKIAIDLWESIKKNSDIYKGDINNPLAKAGAIAGFFSGAESVLDPAPLYDLLKKTFGDMTLEDIYKSNGIHIVVSAFNYNTGREEFYTSFDETRFALARDVAECTSALPVAFKSRLKQFPWNKSAMWRGDGGLVANNPFAANYFYSQAFPEDNIRKAMFFFCGPDTPNLFDETASDGKSYKAYKDAGIKAVGGMLSGQEQIAEIGIKERVAYYGWDASAFAPAKAVCDLVDFTHSAEILQQGYDQAVQGLIYDYKLKCMVNVIDWTRR